MADLKELLAQAQGLSGLQQAKVAAIMGALVADAAGKAKIWICEKVIGCVNLNSCGMVVQLAYWIYSHGVGLCQGVCNKMGLVPSSI